jgi:MFS transporter, PAT family, beta-lactamase induction signal transducer AmpG
MWMFKEYWLAFGAVTAKCNAFLSIQTVFLEGCAQPSLLFFEVHPEPGDPCAKMALLKSILSRKPVNTQAFSKFFHSRKMPSLLLLGFSSGLPLYLTSRTLQAWMTDAKVDLGVIGWASLLGLPYTLKFLWSPFMDRFVPSFLGRRRGWLVITQIGLLLAIAGMAAQNPATALQLLAINALVVVFASASQDIAGDAYRTDVLRIPEREFGAAVWVFGYRIGLVVAYFLALVLADYMPWSAVYLVMSALTLIGLATTFFAPEPEVPTEPPPSLLDAVVLPFREFFQRLGGKQALIVLLFILLYRLGDMLLANMAVPFLLSLQFTKSEIGAIQGFMGLIATIVGGLVGGALLPMLGTNRALWVFGALQALSNLGYLALSIAGKNMSLLVLAINLENFCGGLMAASAIAYFMSLCNSRFSATQFALFSSLMAACGIILAAPAGELAKVVGWVPFFTLSLLAAIPGLGLLPFVAPWGASAAQKID